jgi:hypothetical protein
VWKAHEVCRETIASDVRALPGIDVFRGACDTRNLIAANRATSIVPPVGAHEKQWIGPFLGARDGPTLPQSPQVEVEEIVNRGEACMSEIAARFVRASEVTLSLLARKAGPAA